MMSLPATTPNLSPATKVIEGRADLDARFQNGTMLSASHFKVLIDSTLNQRDDRFYGVWKQGLYPPGSVVYDDVSGFLWKAKKEICSQKPPSEDLDNWESTTYQLQQEVKTLREELTQLKQFVILLGIGLSAIIFWWLIVAIYHFIIGLW